MGGEGGAVAAAAARPTTSTSANTQSSPPTPSALSTPLPRPTAPKTPHAAPKSAPSSSTKPPSKQDASARLQLLNPFVPHKNPETGRWAPPKYSLRRQADLVKAARKAGIEGLLPPGPKTRLGEPVPAVVSDVQAKAQEAVAEEAPWTRPVHWVGIVREKKDVGWKVRMYAGRKRMFKGHKWERVRQDRRRKMRTLMRDMGARVKRYKSVRALSPFFSSAIFCCLRKGRHVLRCRFVSLLSFFVLPLLCGLDADAVPLSLRFSTAPSGARSRSGTSRARAPSAPNAYHSDRAPKPPVVCALVARARHSSSRQANRVTDIIFVLCRPRQISVLFFRGDVQASSFPLSIFGSRAWRG